MIHKDLTIEEILSKYPQKSQRIAQEFTNAGLHCAGCSAATYETLEAGMYGHGFNDEDIEKLIHKLNAVLEEKSDPTTITMTERAAIRFKSVLKEEGKSGWGLRFADKPGGCGGFEYVLDFSKAPEQDDTVFTYFDVDIHVNKNAIDRLLGSEIDYVEGLMGSGFKITNPNVKGSCSCGNSQSY